MDLSIEASEPQERYQKMVRQMILTLPRSDPGEVFLRKAPSMKIAGETKKSLKSFVDSLDMQITSFLYRDLF
jgi:hypothetical protein